MALQEVNGTWVRVDASDFTEANRPDPNTLKCTGCGEPMVWCVGRTKTNQPDTLDSKPVRGPSHFAHKSGTLDNHLEKESDLIARDLAQFLLTFGREQGWSPHGISRSPTQAGIVVYNIPDEGATRTLRFLVSPRPTQTNFPDHGLIRLTGTDGQMGDLRTLILYTPEYMPLSGARLTDYITSGKINKIMVSGYFASVANPRNSGERHFRPRQRKLTEVLKGLASGELVFVHGVDAIPYGKFPTGAAYALVDNADVYYVDKLLVDARPRVKRKAVATEIAHTLGLSLHPDSTTKGNGGRYVFGNADILYVYPGDVDNERGPWREGGRKVVVNPSVKQMTLTMEAGDWKDSLVLFVDDAMRWRDFKERGTLEKLRRNHGKDVLTIRNVTGMKFALKEVEEFLGPEKEIVNELIRSRSWDVNRNFLDYETGVARAVELPFEHDTPVEI